MHEFTIASNILEVIEKVAEENSLTKINSVKLKVGKLRQICPDALQSAFNFAAEDTIAANAKMIVELTPIKMKCDGCGNVFIVNGAYVCGNCDSYSLKTLEGNDIIVETIEGDR